MAQNPEKTRENLSSSPDSPELRVDNTLTMSEGLEDAINTLGNVAEAGERAGDRDLGGTGTRTQTKKTKTVKKDDHQIRIERLLEQAPPVREMIRQIHREINKEVRILQKQAKKVAKKTNNYAEINNTMRKIRGLNKILHSIFKAPIQGIKTLWLKFVHGIM